MAYYVCLYKSRDRETDFYHMPGNSKIMHCCGIILIRHWVIDRKSMNVFLFAKRSAHNRIANLRFESIENFHLCLKGVNFDTLPPTFFLSCWRKHCFHGINLITDGHHCEGTKGTSSLYNLPVYPEWHPCDYYHQCGGHVYIPYIEWQCSKKAHHMIWKYQCWEL